MARMIVSERERLLHGAVHDLSSALQHVLRAIDLSQANGDASVTVRQPLIEALACIDTSRIELEGFIG